MIMIIFLECISRSEISESKDGLRILIHTVKLSLGKITTSYILPAKYDCAPFLTSCRCVNFF